MTGIEIKNRLRLRKSAGMYADINNLGLCGIVVCSFLFIYIQAVLSMKAVLVLLPAFILVPIFYRKPVVCDLKMLRIWLLPELILILSFLMSLKTAVGLFDLIGISAGVILLIFNTNSRTDYFFSFRLIIFFAVFFAAGVFLEFFWPLLYDRLINALPVSLKELILVEKKSAGTGLRGFSFNSGQTAGFLCAGILALVAEGLKKKKVLCIFFLTALFMTGKRAHALFIAFTLLLICMIDADRRQLKKMFAFLPAVLVLICLFSVLFREQLFKVPLLNELVNSVQGLKEGKDITSSRMALYQWAIEQFLKNPVLGIGLDTFRSTTVGNVTKIKELDVHNIYLQLLCESGLIGFLAFGFALAKTWVISLRLYKQCRKNAKWKPLMKFSLIYQTFFLLYGLTGNPLYDFHFQMLYFFSCSIISCYHYSVTRFNSLVYINSRADESEKGVVL